MKPDTVPTFATNTSKPRSPFGSWLDREINLQTQGDVAAMSLSVFGGKAALPRAIGRRTACLRRLRGAPTSRVRVPDLGIVVRRLIGEPRREHIPDPGSA